MRTVTIQVQLRDCGHCDRCAQVVVGSIKLFEGVAEAIYDKGLRHLVVTADDRVTDEQILERLRNRDAKVVA